MSNYERQTWNDYDNSLSLEENIKNNAVVTKEIMNHIEGGIHSVSAKVGKLESSNKDIISTVNKLKTTLDNIPEDVLSLLQNIQAQNKTILDEIGKINDEIIAIKNDMVDDLITDGDRIYAAVSGVAIGEGVDVITPTVDDAMYDGVADGVVNVDNISYS